jgi:hypothetical protein
MERRHWTGGSEASEEHEVIPLSMFLALYTRYIYALYRFPIHEI